MSELSPEPSIPAAGADPGRRKAVAHEARGAQTCAVTSAVGLGKINAPLAVTANPVPRLYNLPRRIRYWASVPLPSRSSSSMPAAVCTSFLSDRPSSKPKGEST